MSTEKVWLTASKEVEKLQLPENYIIFFQKRSFFEDENVRKDVIISFIPV